MRTLFRAVFIFPLLASVIVLVVLDWAVVECVLLEDFVDWMIAVDKRLIKEVE